MKLVLRLVLFLYIMCVGFTVKAQDTLPDFAVKHVNGKVILSWVNNFSVIRQISIQRSADSIKGFKTILTLPDATSITNGFLDNNAPNIFSFYKLYILLDSGKYVFSKSKRPIKESPTIEKDIPVSPAVAVVNPAPSNAFKYKAPTANASNNEPAKPAAQDSVKTNVVKKVIKDTVASVAIIPQPEIVVPEPPSKQYSRETTTVSKRKLSDGLKADSATIPKRADIFTPSSFIFTNPDGNITIVLPSGKNDLFKIKFYDEAGNFVFQINNVKEHLFILDKANFMRSGWFKFEIYEDGLLKEKNKVFVPRNTPVIR